MKRSLSWILACALFISCGGGDNGSGPGDGGNNHPPSPHPTAVGTPDGSPTSATIGAGGGSVTSEDSVFTVTIPAGALASDTLITIQPITNNAWGGPGKAYRLTPDGLQFAVPVSLSFKLTPDDLGSTASQFLDVAVQDDHGFWLILENRSYDNATQTLTATSTHFSDYSWLAAIYLLPAYAPALPLHTVNLAVGSCEQILYSPDGIHEYVTVWCTGTRLVAGVTLPKWTVNGVEGGSADLGTIVKLDDTHALYTAPASIPTPNPVAVSFEVTYRQLKVVLSSDINIGGEYSGDVTRITGSGVPGEQGVWHVAWVTQPIVDNIQIALGTGSLDYTPETLPCTIHTFTPTHANAAGYMIIDRRAEPFTVTVTLTATWDVHECNDCGGTLSCSDKTFLQGFGDGGLGRISADGDTLSGSYFDPGSGENWHYRFVRN